MGGNARRPGPGPGPDPGPGGLLPHFCYIDWFVQVMRTDFIWMGRAAKSFVKDEGISDCH